MASGDSASSVVRPEQPYLEIVHPGGNTNRVALVDSPTLVGRVAECGIRLDHPMVSRQHARFELSDGRWRIIDQKSHNGTRVNKNAVHDFELSHGDCVDIGPFEMTFHHRANEWPAFSASTSQRDILAVNDQTVAIRTLKEIQPPHIAVEHLHGLEELARVLMETKDPAERLTCLCRFMVQSSFGGLWSVAVTMENASAAPQVLCPVQFPAGQHRDPGKPYLSRSLLQATCRRREAMLASNAQGGGERAIELSIAPEVMLITAIAVPLQKAGPASDSSTTGQGGPGGPGRTELLYAVFPPEYGTGEWLALSNLAVNHYRQAEAIWANIERNIALEKLKGELERARRVQDRLVPRSPHLPGLDMAIRFKPCHAVGGDYVDVLPLPDGRALLVIADVCGKGLHAAMVAMGIHTIVHASARRWAGLDDLARAAASHLAETLPGESFVTFLAITVDPRTGVLEVTNAGHPAAMIVKDTDTVQRFGEATAQPLSCDYDPPTVELGQLNDGETLVLFTDGCFEIEGDATEMLGLGAFFPWAAGHIGATASDLTTAADALSGALDQMQGDGMQPDDRTMLLVRREHQ